MFRQQPYCAIGHRSRNSPFIRIAHLRGAAVFTALFLLSTVALSEHREYVIQEGDTPIQIAKKFEITTGELLEFNELKPNARLRAGEKLFIPFPGEVTGQDYVVKPGDSIAKIADFFGVSQKDLYAANGMRRNTALRVGQQLCIPRALRGDALRGHVVRKRDTLPSIAKHYKITVEELAKANKMKPDDSLTRGRRLIIPIPADRELGRYRPKKIDAPVTTGEKVPQGVLHTVQPGQSLWLIADAYDIADDKIIRANRLDKSKSLSVGDRILIPGASEVVPVKAKGAVIQPIHFVSVWDDQSETLKLFTPSGKINEQSRRKLSELAGPKGKTSSVRLFHPRLIHMIQKVAGEFPGRTIEIISGYRPRQPGESLSKHHVGRAIDFRVRGVPKKKLYDFIRSLPKCGAGLYPNSVFVHLDVRSQSTRWTDYSGIREEPRKTKAKRKRHVEAEADANAPQIQ